MKMLYSYTSEKNTTTSYLRTYTAWQVFGGLEKIFPCREWTWNYLPNHISECSECTWEMVWALQDFKNPGGTGNTYV